MLPSLYSISARGRFVKTPPNIGINAALVRKDWMHPMSELKDKVLDKNTPPFERLTALLQVLRSPEGCAWDRKQSHQSLLPYLIEESYEVVEAIELGDPTALREELGDLMCQVVFHAQLAREAGSFTIDDSITHIVEKLIARHPHVFDENKDLTPEQVRDQWEQIKVDSGEKESVLSGIPKSMPALTMAFRIGEKAGGVGFDWKSGSEVLPKLREEIEEIDDAVASDNKERIAEEIGDLLFAVASFARKLDIDPELSLKRALQKFQSRFHQMEQHIKTSGKRFQDFGLDQLEQLWRQAK